MDENEYNVWNELPDKIKIYRGVSVGRVKNGLSWTSNIITAKWFSERFNNNENLGYVLKAIINKEHVLAYFNSRNEDELVVDVFAISKLISKFKN